MAAGRKQGQEPGKSWFDGLLGVLKGGLLGFGVFLLSLGAAAGLIWLGVLSQEQGSGAAIAACVLGGFAGGLLGVKRGGIAPLMAGLGAGVIVYLMLLVMGALVLRAAPALCVGAAAGCLCGGGLAGVLSGGGKRKRRKR